MELHQGADTSTTPSGWYGEFSSPDRLIMLVVDEDAYDFHIDARPGYKASAMKAVLEAARSRGLEPLDEDECEPELLEDGTVRIYLAPITVYAVQPVVQQRPARSIAKRAATTFALAACVAGALILPSPMHHRYPQAVTDVFNRTDDHGAESPTPIQTSPNRGVLSGPESHGPTPSPARSPESLRPQGRVEQAVDRSRERRQAEGAYPHHDVHRLYRGQVELDRLAGSDGLARLREAAGLVGQGAGSGPRQLLGQEAAQLPH